MTSNRIHSKEDKAFITEEVTRRVLAAVRERSETDPRFSLEFLLGEAVNLERDRLKKDAPPVEAHKRLLFWDKVAEVLPRAPEEGREKILARIVRLYVEEIHGDFNPRLHSLATRVLPWVLKVLFSRMSPARLVSLGKHMNLGENLLISGPAESLRSLAQRGTLILVPTHASHLDSIVLGLGLHQASLPPFVYGAGLNLFNNPLLGYFLNRLGAYKVDRRKKNTLYKDTLKQYAALSMERGHHNLFFPGGTRNRRGDVDQHLKLGLLGCGLSAYLSNLQHGAEKPDIFVVPVTLSYGLVLEAGALIDQQLRDENRGRFVPEADNPSPLNRMLRFLWNLQNLDSKIHLHFCEPLDLFGNPVDEGGVSRDHQGRPVDRLKYLEVDGVPRPSPQRDQEYTHELGKAIQASYLRNNFALSTHVTAFAVFTALRKAQPGLDFFSFLLTSGPECTLPLEEVVAHIQSLLVQLRELESMGRIRLDEVVRHRRAGAVFNSALKQFRGFHNRKVLLSKGGRVWSLNLKLLYYYRNHLDHYDLEI